MKTLFIRIEPYESKDYTHPHNTPPPLDIGYAAALLEKHGFESDFIDIPLSGIKEEQIIDKVGKENVNFVFIKFATTSFDKASALAKKLDCTVIGIGQHPSTLPETCLETGFYACIKGEPEEAIYQIVKKKNHKLRGVFYKEKNRVVEGKTFVIKNLDALPFPKHEWFTGKYKLFYPTQLKRKENWGFILATRGCPYNCVFCSPTLRVSWGKEFRWRRVKNVVDEMKFLKNKGKNVIYFLDDNLGMSKRWLLDLCDEIVKREVYIQWVTQIRADQIDAELVRRMKDAGCITLCLGVECGVDKNLRIIKKGQTLRKVKKAFRIIHEEKMLCVAFFMIGVPGETEKEIRRSMELMRQIKPDFIQVAFFTAYPGSKAYEEYGATREFNDFLHYDKIISNQSKVSDKRLVELQKEFYKKFYLSPHFMRKYVKTRLTQLMNNPKAEVGVIIKSLRFLFKKGVRQ
jgi:radical SAM superfamily enzyme YgiQ (UPF0313 family)